MRRRSYQEDKIRTRRKKQRSYQTHERPERHNKGNTTTDNKAKGQTQEGQEDQGQSSVGNTRHDTLTSGVRCVGTTTATRKDAPWDTKDTDKPKCPKRRLPHGRRMGIQTSNG
jgi:hypothetical protein